MSSNGILETFDISKSYSRSWIGGRRLRALDKVNLEVVRGEVFALLGPNGAGKTTLIKLLLGIIAPTQGRARVLGEVAGSKNAKKKIGYLPENLVFPRHLTGIAALRFYGRLSRLSSKTIETRIPQLLELVGLRGREQENVRRYSKGMRQRLGIAQALLHDPEILILDEPTDGLDPLGRNQIRDLILKLKGEGKTLFLNSHILQEVELVCDRVAILSRGELKAIGTIDQLVGKLHEGKSLAIDIHLRRSEAIDKSVFDNAPLACEKLEQISDTEAIFHANADNQNQIDAIIDWMRRSGMSILNLHRHRMKLEDVFMELVERK